MNPNRKAGVNRNKGMDMTQYETNTENPKINAGKKSMENTQYEILPPSASSKHRVSGCMDNTQYGSIGPSKAEISGNLRNSNYETGPSKAQGSGNLQNSQYEIGTSKADGSLEKTQYELTPTKKTDARIQRTQYELAQAKIVDMKKTQYELPQTKVVDMKRTQYELPQTKVVDMKRTQYELPQTKVVDMKRTQYELVPPQNKGKAEVYSSAPGGLVQPRNTTPSSDSESDPNMSPSNTLYQIEGLPDSLEPKSQEQPQLQPQQVKLGMIYGEASEMGSSMSESSEEDSADTATETDTLFGFASIKTMFFGGKHKPKSPGKKNT